MVTFTNVSETDKKNWGLQPGKYARLDYAKTSHDERPEEPLVFRRLKVRVGNGTGEGLASRQTVEDLFNEYPEETLKRQGDTAPVLEIVNWKAGAATAEAKKTAVTDARSVSIARIVNDVMGEDNERPLPDVLGAIGDRMRFEKLTGATRPQAIRDDVTTALGGAGVTVPEGQTVWRLLARKSGETRAAPWILHREAVSEGEAT